jgi:hypothetical protein
VPKRGALERAHIRAELIRLLATGEHSQTALAERYDVGQQSISAFAKRHAADIARVRTVLAAHADDEFAHLWAADKRARIATYQDQVDQIADLMADPESAARAGVQAAEMWRTAQTALKSVAEELGQLPNRSTIAHEGGVSVRYEVVGVALEDLS